MPDAPVTPTENSVVKFVKNVVAEVQKLAGEIYGRAKQIWDMIWKTFEAVHTSFNSHIDNFGKLHTIVVVALLVLAFLLRGDVLVFLSLVGSAVLIVLLDLYLSSKGQK
jgi:hypothetical protein